MGVLDAGCPTRDVLDRIADRWTVLIVIALEDETLRFGRLRRRVEGISPRMLTVTLRRLERDGIVVRKVLNERPPEVAYGLTPRGQSLVGVVGLLRRWSEEHWEAITADRERFDADPPGPPPWLAPVPYRG